MILWAGQAISSTGSQVSRIAFPLLVLTLTGSPAQAGFAAALSTVPYVVLSLPAGALVDRWNRKRVMIVCDSARTVALGSIPVALTLGSLTIAQVYSVALVEGTFNVFFDLAETAALPRVVTREQFSTAMAQNGATSSASSLIGQSIGGALYQLARAFPFLIDSVSYGASVVSLFFIRTRFQGDRQASTGSALSRLRSEVLEGLTWLWNQPLIRFMAFLAAGSWIVLSGNYLLVIVLARQHHAAPAAIGLILAMGGAGGLIGSLLGGWAQRRLGFRLPVVATVWLWALLWPLYALAPNLPSIAIITAAIFLLFSMYNVVQMGYRLAMIPDALQGRVNSVFRLIAFTGQPLGWALSGVLLQWIGPQAAVLLSSGWLLMLALVVTLNPHVRGARSITWVHAR